MQKNKACTHCQKSFLQDRLAEHELLCPITFEKCPHCFYEYPRNFLPTHFNSCPGLLTLCPVCNDEYPLEILQDHINANHLPTPENPNDKKRESSPSFFDKLKNIFSSNDKKDKIKFVKCDKCNKNISLTIYESHIKECKRPIPPPARNSDNQLFSLMMRPQNGNRMIIRQTSRNAALTNEMNELDAEARKMRELMLLMQLLLAQKPTEEKGMKDQEINDNSIICKFEAEKNAGLNEDYKKCSICQCDFENDEDIRIFVCLHRYHKDCADAWLKKKTWCPLCRKSVRSGQEERKEEEEENI